MIVRKPHEDDRRSFRIFLTETGKGLQEPLVTAALAANYKATKGLITRSEAAEIEQKLQVEQQHLCCQLRYLT